MSEENTDQNTAEQAEAKRGASDESATDHLGDAGKKALSAEREARKGAERRANELQAKLDEIEQANMSELEKARKQAEDASTRLREYELTTLRQRVALDKGLPASLVERLRGETEDDLNADADALMALVNAPRSPKPDPQQGGTGEQQHPKTGAEAFAAWADNL